ncbi:MAG: pyruvate carboxylase subunit B [Clostridiales bacterium]|nr:pyruvate carboxylase subunit B [Clostridiales bacterium]
MHQVKICDTTFRDAHQSLLATRMKTEDILAVAPAMDEIGFYSMEVWGGATYDSCMRFLNEDPWERLRAIRKAMPKTKLQMLLRGQNLVGYRHYADDVVDEFVKRAISNGIDIIRIFDALNDLRNLERAMAATKRESAHAQGCISYTNSPVHNIDHFANIAARLRDMGADSICIKDMAGIIYPYGAFDLVKAIKEKTGLPVQMHCHYTSGMASMAYLKAVEAGADILDCANSALALSSSQPCEETMIASFSGTAYDTGIDVAKLSPIAEELRAIRKKYAAFDNADPRVDPNVLRYQIPGGMISNFISQLEQGNAIDRLTEVLDEVPRVREDMGYPPLVTPSSQIVGSQALLNVLQGERYKMATKETQNYFKGEYGAPPAPINQAVKYKVVGAVETITCRPADLIPPMLEEARKEIGAWIETPEDLLLYILFPAVAKPFLENKMAGKTRVEYNMLGGDIGKVNYCPI